MSKASVDVFLHIPKCGGSTIRKVMLKYFKSDEIVRVYGEGKTDSYFSGSRFVDEFDGYYAQQTVKAVCGHITYDRFCKVMNGDVADFNFFTFLRDPIDRAISNINYMKVTESHRSHLKGLSIDAKSLYEVLSREKAQNYQYNYLGGVNGFSVEEIASRVQLNDLKNYKNALFAKGYLKDGEDVEITNVTAPKLKNKKVNEIQLVSRSDLTKVQLDSLIKLNEKDYALIDMAG